MTINHNAPEYLLFAQHGWADTGNNIGRLLRSATDKRTKVIVPSLGLVKTFIRLKPLVRQLEQIAANEITAYPQTPIKIVGHSMGGLMWLEVLERNPQWWNKIHSFVLLGSPIGGSNIARIIDPLGVGIGTAADLGKNRRPIAEKIAQHIPTLSVASDMGIGTDGLVTVENTKFDYANWLVISGIPHSAMRYRAEMIPIMQNFWAKPILGLPPTANLETQLIRRLRNLPGMTDTNYRDLAHAPIVAHLPENLTLHTCNNSLGIKHVYLARQQKCLYAGYVGLMHVGNLKQVLRQIQQKIFED